MSIIHVNKLTKTYHDTEVPVHAVNGIDLSFDKGEFAAIVGPSGCGKTTLMNMIGGLDVPTSGNVVVDGSIMSELSSNKLIDFRHSLIFDLCLINDSRLLMQAESPMGKLFYFFLNVM